MQSTVINSKAIIRTTFVDWSDVGFNSSWSLLVAICCAIIRNNNRLSGALLFDDCSLAAKESAAKGRNSSKVVVNHLALVHSRIWSRRRVQQLRLCLAVLPPPQSSACCHEGIGSWASRPTSSPYCLVSPYLKRNDRSLTSHMIIAQDAQPFSLIIFTFSMVLKPGQNG